MSMNSTAAWGGVKQRSRMAVLLIGVALICAACAGLALIERKPRHTHIFSHKQHTLDENIECSTCHSAVATDGVEKYGMLPKMMDCLTCHMEPFNASNCSYCHLTETPGPLNVPVHEHMNFSHAQHAALVNWDKQCLDCHAKAHVVTQAGDKKLPPMELCLSCHQEWYDNLNCMNCHNGFDKIGLKPLSAFSHAGNFTEFHGALARSQTMLCAQCHEESFCVECHSQSRIALPPDLAFPDNTSRHWMHEGDFISRHPIEARFSSGQCIKCHSPNFCRDCHEREGVADTFPGSRTDLAADPHPLGFGFREDPTDPNFHGRIARREIVSCAGCHDNGSDTICLECHSTIEKGGWGVNPHPRGFHSSLRRTRDRVCLRCHVKEPPGFE